MRTNAWHAAICEQLAAAQGSLGVEQIWQRLTTDELRAVLRYMESES